MKPIDIRNATFRDISGLLEAEREQVYDFMLRHEARTGTVREWAERMGMELGSVAPRVTELCQIGAVELVDRCERRGVYRARSMSEWMVWHGHMAAGGEQLELGL